MARQILPIAGAVIGGAIGGPLGARIGFAVGSIVGNVVDPVQIQGPKIGDLQIQTSRDGVPRPIVFGKSAVMGNIIDRGEPYIVKKKERAGKGGPVTVTERAYLSFAIRICEGPVVGISRVWENEKLVYDGSAANSIPQDSAKFLTMVTFYLGGETQLPDPTLEAIHGVGSTPAHRGTCYAVFKNKDVTDTGGAIPQYRFEVDGVFATPTGNVWLALDQNTADIYVGDYNGASWTLVTTGLPSNELAGSQIIRVANNLYFKKTNTIYYDDVSDLTTWSTQTTTSSPGNGLYSDGTYLYGVNNSTQFVRMTLPSSAITKPLVTGDSESEDITSLSGVLYALTANSTSLYKSSDNGLNWTTTASHGTSISGGAGSIDTDGTMLVFAYVDGVDGYVHSKSSADNGATWSGVQLTLGTAFSATLINLNGMRYHEGKWFAITSEGDCAYSSNGTSWTTGATVPRAVKNVTYGIGKIVVGCNFSEMYETTDHGASWSLLPAPIATGTSIDNMTVHWIGDPP